MLEISAVGGGAVALLLKDQTVLDIHVIELGRVETMLDGNEGMSSCPLSSGLHRRGRLSPNQ